MAPELVLDGVAVRYAAGAAPALAGVDLHVPASTFVVVLGESGSGKSTLLSCLAGFTAPTDGSVRVGGRPVTGPGPDRGVVFQRDVLYPWKTVRRNLEFALRPTAVPRSRRAARVAELLSMVRLQPNVADRFPYELSGGMRQRVGIARMLAGEPEVMLMDEPFAALDAQTRLRMQDLVTDIWVRMSPTVVFVTHDVDEAIRLGDVLVVMGPGGRVSATIDNPLPRPRPAGLLGDMDGYGDLRRVLHELLGVFPSGVGPDLAAHARSRSLVHGR